MLKNFVIFLISVFLLCGCTSNCEKEVVTFSTWGSVTEVSVLKQLISDFEKENPDIKIQLIHTPQNYFQKLHLLFASNTPPDVIFINKLYLPIYESQLDNLSEFVNKKEFYQQALDGLTYDKKLLAIPRDISNLVLYVNKDLISVKTDWSLEEMLTELKKTTNSNVWGISFEEDMIHLHDGVVRPECLQLSLGGTLQIGFRQLLQLCLVGLLLGIHKLVKDQILQKVFGNIRIQRTGIGGKFLL